VAQKPLKSRDFLSVASRVKGLLHHPIQKIDHEFVYFLIYNPHQHGDVEKERK
jgi:hypothetical protein